MPRATRRTPRTWSSLLTTLGEEPGPRRTRAPILLLHGLGASSRVLDPLARYLERELKRPIVRLRLGRRLPLHLGDVRRTAKRVQEEIERLAQRSGFAYVDVVGHSLGGLVATYCLKVLDRGRRVRRVVTLGTPHRGTPLALLGACLLGAVSRAIWQMIPGSPLLRELALRPVPIGSEIVALGSDADRVVPPRSSRPPSDTRMRCAALAGLGHVEFLTSRVAFRAVRAELAA
jgi:pimeloyl-ACP methyl ester carboxylesterase